MYTRAVDKNKTKHFVLEILINTCKQAVKRQSHLSALEKKEKKKNRRNTHIFNLATPTMHTKVYLCISDKPGENKRKKLAYN